MPNKCFLSQVIASMGMTLDLLCAVLPQDKESAYHRICTEPGPWKPSQLDSTAGQQGSFCPSADFISQMSLCLPNPKEKSSEAYTRYSPSSKFFSG